VIRDLLFTGEISFENLSVDESIKRRNDAVVYRFDWLKFVVVLVLYSSIAAFAAMLLFWGYLFD